jgi:hypothetical protein
VRVAERIVAEIKAGADDDEIRAKAEAEAARPRIEVKAGDAAAVDELESALVESSAPVWQRERLLVTVAEARQKVRGGVRRVEGAAVIVPLKHERLWEIASRAARYFKVSAKGLAVDAQPPREHLDALLARGSWRLPDLAGVVEAPTIRVDGSLLADPGYDEASGLLLRADADLCREVAAGVPARPKLDDARRAIDTLAEVFKEFPFVSDADRATALSLVLTLAARHAVDGCVPAFAVDAPTAGTGKGLLAHAAAVIATGRAAPVSPEPASEDEMRKTLLALAVAGDQAFLIDNVERPLRSGALAAAITARVVKGRLLGFTRMAAAPFDAVVMTTGNNLSIRGDLRRRFLEARLDARCERPDERSGFAHDPLLPWVRAERPRLLASALTILCAHAEVGRPTCGLPAFGSFGEWSETIRAAVAWATDADPCETRERLRAADADPDEEVAARLFGAIHAVLCGRPATIRELVDLALAGDGSGEVTPGSEELRAAIGDLLGRGVEPGCGRAVGLKLRDLRGKVLGGLMLTKSEKGKPPSWWVEPCG